MNGDIEWLHRRMIDTIVEKGYLRTARLEEAFRAVPRHPFLPDVPPEKVYSGEAIPTRRDEHGMPTSSSSEPAVMAVMMEQLRPASGQRWLEVGAGTGYNAALIAYLVRPGGAVTTIDLEEDVAREAREHLRAAGFPDVEVRTGDGWLGAQDRAPFDRVEVTASVEDLSPHWVTQLAAGGVLLVPLALRGGAQALVAFRKQADRLTSESLRGGGFMRLRGPHGAPFHRLAITVDDSSIALAVDDIHLATLAALLRSTPRELPAPRIPPEAGTFIVLDEPGAITLWQGREFRFGIYDEPARSLALVGDGKMLVFGADDAAHRLRAWAAHARPIESISVTAVPSDRWSGADDPRVLRRGHYTFVIR